MEKLSTNLISKKLKSYKLQANKGFTHTPKDFGVSLRSKRGHAHTPKDFGVSLRSKRGFTLIETLVAITVLTISIVGPITIASRGLFSAMFARDQITAFYLAQEAVELIRNKRDENRIKGNDWLSGLGTCSNGTACIVDTQNNSINNCPLDACPTLKYDEDTGFYNYSTGINSIFTRKVKLEEINLKESSIIVTLSWSTGAIEKTFTIKENILNW